MTPWRAHDALFKLIVVGLGLAAFSALLAIATVAINLSSSGRLLIIQRPAQATTVAPTGSTAITIPLVDQLCYSDTDCTVVQTRCDACGCGETVNRIYGEKYQGQHRAQCTGYRGVTCNYPCPTPYVRCLGGRCTLSATPPPPSTP